MNGLCRSCSCCIVYAPEHASLRIIREHHPCHPLPFTLLCFGIWVAHKVIHPVPHSLYSLDLWISRITQSADRVATLNLIIVHLFAIQQIDLSYIASKTLPMHLVSVRTECDMSQHHHIARSKTLQISPKLAPSSFRLRVGPILPIDMHFSRQPHCDIEIRPGVVCHGQFNFVNSVGFGA